MGIHKPDWSNLSNLFGNISKGYEQGQLPQKLAHERLSEQLRNSILGTEAKYAEPKAQQGLQLTEQQIQEKQLANDLSRRFGVSEKQADIGLKNAHAKHYEDTAAGRTFAPTGLGKLVQERNDIAAKNPNDPILAEYDRAIKTYGGKKFAPTGLGKLYTELQEIEEGFLPGSNGQVSLNAAEQDDLRNRYQLQIQKSSTDSGTRNTVLRGQNLLKSIDASNIDALTRYSGPMGAAKLKIEQAKDLSGHPSKEYLEHLESVQAAKLEAKEVRQFFGDSITPGVQDALYEMVNATSLTKSPEAAKRMIQKSRDTITKQVKTFENALNNPNAYSSPEPHEVLGSELMNGINGASEKMIKVKYKGKIKLVPSSKLQAALAAGGVYAGE